LLQAAKRGGGAAGRGRGRKKSGGEDDMDPGTGSIFDVVKGGRSSLQVIMIIMY
jgi:hypothetical protein